jgi:Halocarboxylic acid dehydrogenase DehI
MHLRRACEIVTATSIIAAAFLIFIKMSWRKGNRMQLLGEGAAQGRTREIYDDLRSTLGLPLVPTSFQAFANYPEFLELAWDALRPLARTQQFFALSERLRADAYTRSYTYFQIPDLSARLQQLEFSRGACEEMTSAIEMLNHGASLIALLLAVLLQSFEGPIGQDCDCDRPAIRPVYSERPLMIDEEHAAPDVQRVFEDVRRTLKLPSLTLELRALARWPEFFADYWQALKKCVESPLYEVCFRGANETAFALAREIPLSVELTTAKLADSGISEEHIASVLRITDSFATATIGTVLNVAFAKIGLEGGNTHAATPGRVA